MVDTEESFRAALRSLIDRELLPPGERCGAGIGSHRTSGRSDSSERFGIWLVEIGWARPDLTVHSG
ncbi:hypothetical protein [Saccharopolyspora shandongensis]|uniref:hypothetical protein n=1 Tax=Saccharopolyspora shandongensis TaxID=418495 RepID=UPI000B83FF62|nr:hypothetical protein [Saccharopolyspora shandongensis]